MLYAYNVRAKMRYIKYCLIIFTLLFLLSGVSLIVIGTTINAIYSEFSSFIPNRYFSPSIVLTGSGFFTLAVACFGLYGALKENAIYILIFSMFLGTAFIIQIAAGISCKIVMYDLHYDLNRTISNVIKNYHNNNYSRASMDNLQSGLHCCGVYDASNWMDSLNSSLTVVPSSCCSKINSTCEVYPTGCYDVLHDVITEAASMFLRSTYVLSAMQLMGMFFSIYLARILKIHKMAMDARRLFVRDKLLNEPEEFSFNNL